jgi:carboxyl-terminal processing protease
MKTQQYPSPRRGGTLVLLGLCLLTACTSSTPSKPAPGNAHLSGKTPRACVSTLESAPPHLGPTTLTTHEQAYWCLFDHYVTGETLDDRVLLNGAFIGFVQELLRRGVDQPMAMLPALSGDRQADWQTFSAVYQHVIQALPQGASLQQDLAAATMQGMVGSLDDDHTRWGRPIPPPAEVVRRFPNGALYGLGIVTSASGGVVLTLPEAQPPLFIFSVWPGSPAAQHGVRPGDIITAVNGIPPFSNGQINPGVMAWLSPPPSQSEGVHVTLQRPATGQTWTIDLTPGPYAFPGSPVSARVLAGSLAYIQLAGFDAGAGYEVLGAIHGLKLGKYLRGIILDLRSNGGGDPSGVAELLGAFVHGKIWSYDLDREGKRVANQTEDSVPLLHQPLVVLTDRRCFSACEAFTGAVRDLGLGKIVGMRTGGKVAGPAYGYGLDDGSVLAITVVHEVGARGERIDEIGVAPDYVVPLTAEALSAGHDAEIEKAISVLS